jgi:hypothetical protein
MLHKLFAGHSPGLLALRLQDRNCRIVLLLDYKVGKSRSKQDDACKNNYGNHYTCRYFAGGGTFFLWWWYRHRN